MKNSCLNCNHPVESKYCSNCGQRNITVPFTFKDSVLQWIIDSIDFEKGYFKTVYHLLLKPKLLLANYLAGKVKNYVNPIKLLLITIAIFAVLDLVNSYVRPEKAADDDSWLAYLYLSFFVIPIWLLNLIFFRNSKYTSFENLIIALYESNTFIIVMVPSVFISSLFFDDKPIISVLILVLITVPYHIYFTIKIFTGPTWMKFLKSFLIIIITYFVFGFIAASITPH